MITEAMSASNSYLSFKIGEELFAAHVSKVLNILELTRITRIPQSPEYMLGIINLRGTVLPVIDTRIKFGIPASEFTSHTCIIVMDIDMHGESLQIGALVDSVQEVLEVEKAQIQAAPSIGNKFRSEFIQGVMKINDEFIMLLNMDRVFSSDELAFISSANSESPVE